MTGVKDYLFIVLGILIYGIAFTAFILPHGIVIGGVSGVATLVYFATNGVIPVAVSQYGCNLILLALAFRIVGRTFVLRTIFGATVASLFIGIFESFLWVLDIL